MQSGPGFVPTFLYYFVSTTCIVAFVLSKGFGNTGQLENLDNPFQVAILFGLIAGGLAAYFNSHEQMEIPVKKKEKDIKKLNQTLNAMGYSETDEIEQTKVYDRPFPASLFAGKLFVQAEEQSIHISGRASRIRGLKKALNPLINTDKK